MTLMAWVFVVVKQYLRTSITNTRRRAIAMFMITKDAVGFMARIFNVWLKGDFSLLVKHRDSTFSNLQSCHTSGCGTLNAYIGREITVGLKAIRFLKCWSHFGRTTQLYRSHVNCIYVTYSGGLWCAEWKVCTQLHPDPQQTAFRLPVSNNILGSSHTLWGL